NSGRLSRKRPDGPRMAEGRADDPDCTICPELLDFYPGREGVGWGPDIARAVMRYLASRVSSERRACRASLRYTFPIVNLFPVLIQSPGRKVAIVLPVPGARAHKAPT